MAYSPLNKLLKILGGSNDEEIRNQYDDGSIWTLPEEDTTSINAYNSPVKTGGLGGSINLGLKNLPGYKREQPIDELESARNQVDYYTGQLNDLGQQEVKPSLLQKGLGAIGSLLTRVGAVPGTLSNTLAGAKNKSLEIDTDEFLNITNSNEAKQISDLGFEIKKKGIGYSVMPTEGADLKNFKQANDLLSKAQKNSGATSMIEAVKRTSEITKEGLKSGGNTLTGLFTGKYSEKNVDWGKVLDNHRLSPDESISSTIKLLESPGFYGAKVFGASDETATSVGNIVADLGISLVEGNFTDIDGAGKTLKYLRQNDKMQEVSKVTKLSDAIELANKYNNYDDYVKTLGDKASKYNTDELTEMFEKSKLIYAEDLVKDAQKGLGGIKNFDGLKIGQGTISKEALDKISQNKVKNTLTQIGLGLYSPVGAVLNNPIVDKIAEVIDKTEVGTALKNDLKKGFFGGKDNEWINAMANNPDNALKYANERKQKGLAKTFSNERIQKTMEDINKYSDVKESPEELTKIIESPTSMATRTIEVERQLDNPTYIKKMYGLANEEINSQTKALRDMQNVLKNQKDELLNIGKEAKGNESNIIKIKNIDEEISNLEKRIGRFDEISSVKSIDFNKQMKKLGYTEDYSKYFDKAIKTDIETLTKELGDRDLAEAIQESANRVLDEVDNVIPGMSKYYSGSGTVDVKKSMEGTVFNSMKPEEYSLYKAGSTDDKIKFIIEKIGKTDKPELIKEYKFELAREYRTKANELAKEITGNKISKENAEYIDGLDLDSSEKFIEHLENKKKYIKSALNKPTELKEIREYLGTKPTNLKDDIIKLSEKRIKKEYVGNLVPSIETSKASKKHEVIGSAKAKDTAILDVMNNANEETLNKVAKKIAYEKEPGKMVNLYKNSIKKTLKQTYETLEGYMYHEVDNSLMVEEARDIAKEFVRESKIKVSLRELTKNLTGKDLNGAVEELIKASVKNKEEISAKYLENAKKLTDSEIEILLGYDSSFKLAPTQIIEEFEANGVKKVAKATSYESQKKALKKEELIAQMKEKEKGAILDSAGENISVTGEDRTKWLEQEEAKRYEDKMDKEYTGGQLVDDEDLLDSKYKENRSRILSLKEKIENRNNTVKTNESDVLKEVATDKVETVAEVQRPVTEASKEVVKETPKKDTPIAKIVEKNIPPKYRNINGIKFNTPTGEVLIENTISTKDLNKVLKQSEYSGQKVGSRIIYSDGDFTDNKILGQYNSKTDTIIINTKALNKKATRTLLEHELGHRVVDKLLKTNPDFDLVKAGTEFVETFSKLDDKAKYKLIDVIEKVNKTNAPTKDMLDIGVVTKYINTLFKGRPSKELASNEVIAELNSLFNNNTKAISKSMREVNEELTNKFDNMVSGLKEDDIKEVAEISRKRFGVDYANSIVKLKQEKEAVGTIDNHINKLMKGASDINKTQNTIEDIKDNIDSLSKVMNTTTYDEEGNLISKGYDELFETVKKKYPDKVSQIDKTIARYKTINSLEEEVFNIDNTSSLTPKAKEMIETYKNSMKEIALREGIYETEEDAEAFATYVQHMINPMYKADAEIIEKGRKLKAELTNPINQNAKNRTKEGTIEELNNMSDSEIGKRIFEENINRIWLDRSIKSEKFVLKDSQNKRILGEFSIPIIKDFNVEVNSEKFFKENYIGYTDELLKEYKESKMSAYDFLISKGVNKKEIQNFTANGYAKELLNKYGATTDPNVDMLDNIPVKTEDGRPLVPKEEFKGDRNKELPYGIEGNPEKSIKQNYIKAYNEFIYKEAKDRDMVIIELPKESAEKVMKRTLTDEGMEQGIKNRENIAENISELIKGDKEALEGFEALAGFNVIDPKHIKYEEFLVDSGTNKVLIDRQAWDNYQKAIKDAEYKQKNALLKVYDYMSDMFKSQAIFSVGFHERNGIQNIISSYIKSGANLLNPKKNKEAIDIMMYKAGKKTDIDKVYNGYNVDEILREAKLNGIFETQLKNEFDKDDTKKFLEGATDKLETKKTPLKKLANPFSKDFVGYKASMKVGSAIEEEAKIVNILTHLDSGYSLSDAIELTKNALFDYSDLTKFEQTTMKRIFPFYTFMSKNIPSQIDNLANHNARVGRVERVYRKASEKNETEKDRALRPDYLDGQLALGNNKYLNLGKATDDLNKLINPVEMASGLNPIIKTPIELLFNKQFYRDADISKYDKPGEKVKYAVQNTIPVTKQVSALHKLITGTEDEQVKAKKTFKKALGDLTNSYDSKTQEKATMYKYVEELQNQYYEYLEKNPGAKEDLVKLREQSKRKNTYSSPIKKLIK